MSTRNLKLILNELQSILFDTIHNKVYIAVFMRNKIISVNHFTVNINRVYFFSSQFFKHRQFNFENIRYFVIYKYIIRCGIFRNFIYKYMA